jgi:two-component system, probable response regulator PhcQ
MTKTTILYVDDEPMALKYFDRLISPYFKVLTASSVAQGIAVLSEKSAEISVLISDQRMPGSNGNELLSYSRVHFPHIVRLLTTAYSDLTATILAINSGEIYRYITKPWDPETLKTEVRLSVELAQLRAERDQLLEIKKQTQQANLLANRVNNLALICGCDGLLDQQKTQLSHAIFSYIALVKQMGPVDLVTDLSKIGYPAWMQNEVLRFCVIKNHLADWLALWKSAPVTPQTLWSALGERGCRQEDVTTLWTDNSALPLASSFVCFAWFIAVSSQNQCVDWTIDAQSGIINFTLSPAPAGELTPLPSDWLLICMENF